MRYSFKTDYAEGAHPEILSAIIHSNEEQMEGYAMDAYCHQASLRIKEKLGNPDAAVHFITGGTQANAVIISFILRPWESVICADTGHIHVHEAGAVERRGNKINAVHCPDGKLTSEKIGDVLWAHPDEHMVKPRLVFISNATETGTIYQKQELKTISRFCRENNLILYLDGARLGCALTAEKNDLQFDELADLVDLFYIGGTKNGGLLGEAIVINNPAFQKDFRYQLKQQGALLAKSRVLGAQFERFFKDDLYFLLAAHANRMAARLSSGIRKMGCDFLCPSQTNQIFPIFSNLLIEKLSHEYGFYVWEKTDPDHSAVRMVTSWATPEKIIDRFLSDLKKMR